MDNWKGVKKNLHKSSNTQWEIYNIEKDPFEKYNMFKDKPEIGLLFDKIILKEHNHPKIKEWEILY